MEQIEKFFKCPFCLEKISMLLDTSEDGLHSYTEDCEVCCHAIEVNFLIQEHTVKQFKAHKSYD